ncbi:MAG: hypothetical protein HY720_20125, partial [Planctomycetes bacterium]|nr:hypothetical protein [Planctomycetota bacterium]
GRFEEAAKLYAELAEEAAGDERAEVGLLAALLGRARIGVDLAAEKGTGDGWKEVEELLARFEEGVGIRPELLAEGGAVYEGLSDRRIASLHAALKEYARRVKGRPELVPRRTAEVQAEVVRLRERYARKAADLYWSAARHTGRHALRIDAAWRAAENYRLFGQVAAEVLALEDFVARADDDPRHTAALYHLGRAYERRGFLENAVLAHRTNTDLFPSTPFSYRSRYELGRIAEEAGDLEEALARYSSIRNDASAEFDPDSRVWRDALFRLAALSERLDDRGFEGGAARAEELYREAVERYPADPRIGFAHYRLALLADRKDRYADAALDYGIAIRWLDDRIKGPSAPPEPAGESPESSRGPAAILRACRYAYADLLYRQALAAPVSERSEGLERALAAYKDAYFRHPGGYEEAWAHYQMSQAYRLLDRADWSEQFLAQAMNLLAKVEGGTGPGAFDPPYWKRILEWARSEGGRAETPENR